MLNHRALQRTLFLVQLDPALARSLHDGERLPGLGDAELACLRAVDPRALSADRDGARRAQFLRNVGSEFPASIARLGAAALERFACSPELHRAVQRGERLPLALGRHLARAAVSADADAAAVVALERALARARRRVRAVPVPPRDHVVLAGSCELLDVLAGTLERAARLCDGAGVDVCAQGCEHLLVRSRTPAPPARLRDVEVEQLSPALARFVREARHPLSRAARARIGAELDASEAEIEELAEELLGAGILIGDRSVAPRIV